jgi:uncharacterized cupredoxin-like copper-binding protein
MTIPRKLIPTLVLSLLPALALAAGSHGATDHAHGSKPAAAGQESAAGVPGDPAKVSRTIAVEMFDTMRFTPDKINVKAGETVRFFIVNKGKVPHEMVIGMPAEIEEHAEMMRKMPGMVHKEPNQITLAPGQSGGIVWTFTQAGTVSYVCLVPGHREAGMVGAVEVK